MLKSLIKKDTIRGSYASFHRESLLIRNNNNNNRAKKFSNKRKKVRFKKVKNYSSLINTANNNPLKDLKYLENPKDPKLDKKKKNLSKKKILQEIQ